MSIEAELSGEEYWRLIDDVFRRRIPNRRFLKKCEETLYLLATVLFPNPKPSPWLFSSKFITCSAYLRARLWLPPKARRHRFRQVLDIAEYWTTLHVRFFLSLKDYEHVIGLFRELVAAALLGAVHYDMRVVQFYLAWLSDVSDASELPSYERYRYLLTKFLISDSGSVWTAHPDEHAIATAYENLSGPVDDSWGEEERAATKLMELVKSATTSDRNSNR